MLGYKRTTLGDVGRGIVVTLILVVFGLLIYSSRDVGDQVKYAQFSTDVFKVYTLAVECDQGEPTQKNHDCVRFMGEYIILAGKYDFKEMRGKRAGSKQTIVETNTMVEKIEQVSRKLIANMR